jgi:hypothetical protein
MHFLDFIAQRASFPVPLALVNQGGTGDHR